MSASITSTGITSFDDLNVIALEIPTSQVTGTGEPPAHNGMPGDDTLLRQVREVAPQAKVIVYSGYVRLMQDGALGKGADAYLEKGDDDGPLVAAIRSVVS